jgi:hypothetical protein
VQPVHGHPPGDVHRTVRISAQTSIDVHGGAS